MSTSVIETVYKWPLFETRHSIEAVVSEDVAGYSIRELRFKVWKITKGGLEGMVFRSGGIAEEREA